MYNRYIPQPDGSYRRNRVSDPAPFIQPDQFHPPEPSAPQEPPCHQEQPRPTPPPPEHKQVPPHSRQGGNAGDFLRQLLPKNLDTGDLLILLLLLLMAGDSQEDKNTALLTLALYLFM